MVIISSAPQQSPPPAAVGVRVKTSRLLHRIAHKIEPSPYVGAGAVGQNGVLDSSISFCKKLFRRMMIWTFSLFVAFYVPLSEAGIPFPLEEWEKKIIDGKRFPDVFLATVAMIVLSASDLVDNIIARKSHQVGSINVASAWIFMAIYILFILYGMPAYSSSTALAAQTYLPWGVLGSLLAVGVAGELLIATVPD